MSQKFIPILFVSDVYIVTSSANSFSFAAMMLACALFVPSLGYITYVSRGSWHESLSARASTPVPLGLLQDKFVGVTPQPVTKEVLVTLHEPSAPAVQVIQILVAVFV